MGWAERAKKAEDEAGVTKTDRESVAVNEDEEARKAALDRLAARATERLEQKAKAEELEAAKAELEAEQDMVALSQENYTELVSLYGAYKKGLSQVADLGFQTVLGPRVMLYAVLKEDLFGLALPTDHLKALNALFYVVIQSGDDVPRKKRKHLRPMTLVVAASAAANSLDWTDANCRYAYIHHEDIMYSWSHDAFLRREAYGQGARAWLRWAWANVTAGRRRRRALAQLQAAERGLPEAADAVEAVSAEDTEVADDRDDRAAEP